MSATTTPAATSALPAPRPRGGGASPGRVLRLGMLRTAYEVRSYFRVGDTVFFTFLFPVLMLTIFSVAFSDGSFGENASGQTLGAADYYLSAMLAAGILLSGVQNLAVDIAMEKSDGTLKRLAGSPLPVASYFLGKIGQVFVTATLQAALILLLGAVVFGVDLPTEPGRWLTFAWVFVLGVATSAVLGIGLSGLPRSGKSATAVIIPIVLILQFISGVYLVFSQLPEWLQNVASFFPLKWMAQGMRYVFLPEGFEVMEQNGDWNLTGIGIALAVWLVAGLVVARLTFRWIRKDS